MKQPIIITSLLIASSLSCLGQGALDALPMTTSQLKGTARYTAMGGAFGALGGDISTIRQNPAGLGIYRSSEITVTGGLNFYNNSTKTSSNTNKNSGFFFSGDNLGFVGTIRFRNSALRTLNFGFAYNNVANFNNDYSANWTNIGSSLTQLIAQQTTAASVLPNDMIGNSNYNPYSDSRIPWLSILGYNAFLTNSLGGASAMQYESIYSPLNNTTGNASLHNITSGSIDEYDINVSGNISDMLYWGLTLGLTNIDYRIESIYGETLQNALLFEEDAQGNISRETVNADYDLANTLRTNGYGFGVKLGVIFRPASFLRVGFAYHSPTYYRLSDTYWAGTDYNVGSHHGTTDNNYTDVGISTYEYHSPWRIIGSVAAILGKVGLLSVDYEYSNAKNMSYGGNNSLDYTVTNTNINSYMAGMSTVRVGGEVRILPMLSLRAGYAYEGAQLNNLILDHIITPEIVEGTLTTYYLPHDAHNISCGLGSRVNNITLDLAYVHRIQEYDIYPFTPLGNDPTPLSGVMDMRYNSVKLTIGYKF